MNPSLAAVGNYVSRLMVEADVWRRVSSDDGSGGQTYVWSQIGQVDVQLVAPSATEEQVAAQHGTEITHSAVFLPGATVARGDRLTAGDVTVELVSDPLVATHSAVARAQARQEPEPT